ncbi:MAG: hypothetical protein ACREFK_10020 [Stellaceae bacterium]
MSIKETVSAVGANFKTFLAGRTPAAQLAEIEAEIAARQAERDQLAESRPRFVLVQMQGDGEAGERVQFLNRQVAALDARLRDLREAAGQAQRVIATEAEATRRREAAERPKRIAQLVKQRMHDSEEIYRRAKGLAEKIMAMKENAQELAVLLDSEHAARSFGFGGFTGRVRSALAHLFWIDPTKPLTPENNLLQLRTDWVGARAWMTLAQFEQELCDDLAAYFDDRAEAEAAQARLAGRHAPTLIVPIAGGCFTLVRVEHAFGDRAGAEAAAPAAEAGGKRHVVIAHDGGFVLVPERFAGLAEGTAA